ncbi:MAG: hypothetical protein GX094_01670 [Clostridiales bacterium]|nr:hypothetical protein [Clostridiales bacterium]
MWYIIIGVIVVILLVIYFIRKRGTATVQENPLEKYLNQEAVVTEPISDTLGTGKIQIDGQEIQARRNGPGVIGIGTKVIIVDVGTSICTVKVKEDNS